MSLSGFALSDTPNNDRTRSLDGICMCDAAFAIRANLLTQPQHRNDSSVASLRYGCGRLPLLLQCCYRAGASASCWIRQSVLNRLEAYMGLRPLVVFDKIHALSPVFSLP